GPAALAGHPPGYVTTTSRGARAIEGAPRRGALPLVFSLRAGGRGPWAGAQQPGALRPSPAVRSRRVHHPRPVTHRPSPPQAPPPLGPGPAAVAGHPPGYVTTPSRAARASGGAPRRGALPLVFSPRAGGRGPWAGAQQPGALRPSPAVRSRRVQHPRPVTHRP